jgi:hypothetical protein
MQETICAVPTENNSVSSPGRTAVYAAIHFLGFVTECVEGTPGGLVAFV